MKCRVYLQCLIVGCSLLLFGGCSYSRGSQVSRASETGQKMADELAEDDASVKTVSAEESAADAGDGPPSQPGVKSSGGSRKKLTGWLGKGKTKSSTIPLDRTDKSRTADADSTAEEDSGWWKHQEAPATAQNEQSGKSKDPDALSLSSSNPFDR